MSPLTEPLSRLALPQVEGAGDFSVREYEQVAGAITARGTASATSPRSIRSTAVSFQAVCLRKVQRTSHVARRQ